MLLAPKWNWVCVLAHVLYTLEITKIPKRKSKESKPWKCVCVCVLTWLFCRFTKNVISKCIPQVAKKWCRKCWQRRPGGEWRELFLKSPAFAAGEGLVFLLYRNECGNWVSQRGWQGWRWGLIKSPQWVSLLERIPHCVVNMRAPRKVHRTCSLWKKKTQQLKFIFYPDIFDSICLYCLRSICIC